MIREKEELLGEWRGVREPALAMFEETRGATAANGTSVSRGRERVGVTSIHRLA